MIDFSRTKISAKVMMVIAVLSLVSAAIAGGGIFALAQLNTATDRIDASARQSSLLALMTQDVMGLSRTEFRLAVDPSTDEVESARKSFDNRSKSFANQLSELRNVDTNELVEETGKLESQYANYSKHVAQTIEAAEALNGATDIGPNQAAIAELAMMGRKQSMAMEETTSELVKKLIANGSNESAAATELYNTASLMMILGALAGVVAGVAIGLYVSQAGIVSPIRGIVNSLQKLAAGDLDSKVYGVERKDEVGEIAATTQVFRNNLIEAKRMRDEQEAARVDRERRQAVINAAIDKFEKTAEEVVQTVSSASTELQAASNTLSSSASGAAMQASSVAAAAEQTSGNVQSVAAAAEELAASVREIGARAQDANNLTLKAVGSVNETDTTVKGLEEAARKIGAVVALIGDVAAQTNLLALNATIEAARAGESGRGFAVVAGEVKALAEQAARATEEISREIESIQAMTTRSVSVIGDVGSQIHEISSISSSIAAAVQQQSAATQEISRSVQQASSGTADVTQNIGAVSVAAAETGAAASQVMSAASDLAQQSSILRKAFDGFIATVRAA